MSGNKFGKRLKPEEWIEIQARYEAGEEGRKLAEEFGIAPETISRRATRDGWKKSTELRKQAIEAAQEEIVQDLKERAKKVHEWLLNVYILGAKGSMKLLREMEAGGQIGKRGHELQAVAGSLQVFANGIRQSLRLDQYDPYGEEDQAKREHVLERLLNIMTPEEAEDEEGEAESITQDDDESQAYEAEKEARRQERIQDELAIRPRFSEKRRFLNSQAQSIPTSTDNQ